MTTLDVTATRQDDTLAMGLRQEWISGEDETVTFDLTCGAGVGSPWLILTVTEGEETVRETVDMREVVRQWVDKVRAS